MGEGCGGGLCARARPPPPQVEFEAEEGMHTQTPAALEGLMCRYEHYAGGAAALWGVDPPPEALTDQVARYNAF